MTKELFNLAFLNVKNNLRRSLLIITLMGICGAALIVLGGFINFTYDALRETTIRTQLGHLQISQKDFNKYSLSEPFEYLIGDFTALTNQLSDIKEIDFLAPRLSFNGLIANNNTTLPAMVVGVSTTEKFSNFEKIIAGNNISEKDSYSAVLGLELAKALNIQVGESFTILASTIDGSLNAIDLEVKGIAQTGSGEYDKVFVKMPIAIVQEIIDTTKIAQVLVLLKNTKDVAKVENILDNILDKSQYEYTTWLEKADYYQGVVNIYDGFFGMFKIITTIVAFFSISNAISMAIFERTKEIGTLRAIGFSKKDIINLFSFESVILGALGALFAFLLAIVVMLVIDVLGGIYISPPPGQSAGYTAFIDLVPSVIAMTCLIIVGCASLASLFLSVKAVNKKIIEALNYV